MEVKICKVFINDDGSFRFIDKRDEEAFNRTLLFLKKNKGVNKVELVINTIEEDSTDRQKKLFIVLCKKICQETTQYSFETVMNSFLSYFGFSSIHDVPKERFNELIEFSVSMSNELFNVEVRVNPDNHHIEIL